MKIVQVIHGYPMRYNAGSEVYTQTLAHALANRHDVHVFTRQHNSFLPDYHLQEEHDPADPRVQLHVINLARTRDRYRHTEVDQRFGALLALIQPALVHVGHLSHLSTSVVLEAYRQHIPVVFTLHDFWLMCPRGQFIQQQPTNSSDLWSLCDGQEDRKCAERCYSGNFSGDPETDEADVSYWTAWVHQRMAHIRRVCDAVDLFLAPSQYVLRRFREEFGLPGDRLVYLDYGFDFQRLTGRCRVPDEPFTFGYIGTHIPAKGVNHLVEAFGRLSGAPVLRIWGRPQGMETESLRVLANSLPGAAGERIEWLGEYRNSEIVEQVFNRCDAIVVPSIWGENSPLVIHEALQARLPVITADAGGMAEYVGHEQNGLLFTHRRPEALAAQMQRFVDDPALALRLGQRGYLQSADGNVVEIEQHVRVLEGYYAQVVTKRRRGDHADSILNAPGSLADHI